MTETPEEVGKRIADGMIESAKRARRERLSEAVLLVLAADVEWSAANLARHSVAVADALIAELDK